MNVGTGRENIIILFWKKRGSTVSFLGIHKWEPDIYIGFLSALHCQCITRTCLKALLSKKIEQAYRTGRISQVLIHHTIICRYSEIAGALEYFFKNNVLGLREVLLFGS